MLLSGLLSDTSGATTLKIVDNEWIVGDENWDVEIQGPRVTIRRGVGDIALQFKVVPPRALVVERIDMELDGCHLKGNENSLSYSYDGKSWNSMSAIGVDGFDVGISIEG
ncbi:hypothetical protein PSCICE_02830 [Pseudomonas cichorii]|nr:hypothetical protein PSCICE_02830 [Pseudomonas cichorii]